MNKPIGIIGMGDLGSQLADWITGAGLDVIAFDKNPAKIHKSAGVRIAISEDEVLENCSIVHWAAPSRSMGAFSQNLKNKIVILHDSVMSNSLLALSAGKNSNKFVIAHCLMNDASRIFVATDVLHDEHILNHLRAIGLNPKLTPVKSHDTLMARSQGILALLIELGLKDELDQASRNGDLTPSADELHRVLMNRKASWTPSTLESILANPELKRVIRSMALSSNDSRAGS